MSRERSFGISVVSEENPYNLERYGNETTVGFEEINSQLDEITTRCLDLPLDCEAESHIWQFKKEPWQFYRDAGQLLFTLENIKFCALKSKDNDLGFRCQTILRLDWTNHETKDIQSPIFDIPMLIRVRNRADDDIMLWDLGRLGIASGWVRRPISFMQDIDPELFGDIEGINWSLFISGGRLYEC